MHPWVRLTPDSKLIHGLLERACLGTPAGCPSDTASVASEPAGLRADMLGFYPWRDIVEAREEGGGRREELWQGLGRKEEDWQGAAF